MKTGFRVLGFSLVEVLIAIGVIALALPAIISLLGSTHVHSQDAIDRHSALSAVVSIEALIASNNLDRALAIVVSPGERAPEGSRLYVSRDLTRFGWADDVEPAIRYYAITLERNEQIEIAGAFVVTFRIEWPALALNSPNGSASTSEIRTSSVFIR